MRSVAAVYYPPDNQLEVFSVDKQGALIVVWKEENGNWQGPISLTSLGFAPPNASIAAVYNPSSQQLEVFVFDISGAVNLLWKVQNESWNGPMPLTTQGFAPIGAGVAAAYYPPFDQMEVFTINTNGVLNVIWKEGNGNWNEPIGITELNFAPPGAEVKAIYYLLQEQLEVFFAGNYGALHCVRKHFNTAWEKPTDLTEAWLVAGGTPLSAVFYPPSISCLCSLWMLQVRCVAAGRNRILIGKVLLF
ncbi:hypothetical protein [Daejeonella sp.]|uniref:hypothetical protein n=1 Tax=Daejeonella sp. TaxID=2805397 RepID=UPI0030EDB954